MRLTPIIDSGPFDTGQACRAAGIDKNRLALWHHRSQFQSDEDRREDRLPGDPRQYSGVDAVRMRLLATLTDRGIPMTAAQAALALFDRTGYREPWVLLLTDDGRGFQARAVRPDEVGRVLMPTGGKGPKLAVVLSVDSIINQTTIELDLIRAEQAAGRLPVMGWISSDAEVRR